MENRRGTDGIKNLRGLVQVLGKYRYALIVLLVGAHAAAVRKKAI